MDPLCQFCGKQLEGKQKKFCSRSCKDQWWNQRRREQIEGFGTLEKALEEAEADELQNQREINGSYVRGIQRQGGDLHSILLTDLPYPNVAFRDPAGGGQTE